jgi:hypothetical protein
MMKDLALKMAHNHFPNNNFNGAEFIKNLARPKNLNKKQSSFKRKENKEELVSIKHVKL